MQTDTVGFRAGNGRIDHQTVIVFVIYMEGADLITVVIQHHIEFIPRQDGQRLGEIPGAGCALEFLQKPGLFIYGKDGHFV